MESRLKQEQDRLESRLKQDQERLEDRLLQFLEKMEARNREPSYHDIAITTTLITTLFAGIVAGRDYIEYQCKPSIKENPK